MVNLEKFLVDSGVRYVLRGKNMTDKFINICCPVCLERKFHCGINKEHGWFKCFVCEAGGTWYSLLKELSKHYKVVVNNSIYKFSAPYIDDRANVKKFYDRYWIEVDKERHKNLYGWITKKPSNLKEVYRSRGVDFDKAVDFGLKLGIDKLRNFAVFCEGGMQIGRKYYDDGDGKRWMSYSNDSKGCYGETFVMQMRPRIGYVVEGVFDALRFPLGSAVALRGVVMSNEIIYKLMSLFGCSKKVVFCLDRDVSPNRINQAVLELGSVGIKSTMFDWSRVGNTDIKDVDELYLTYGEEGFKKIIREAEYENNFRDK